MRFSEKGRTGCCWEKVRRTCPLALPAPLVRVMVCVRVMARVKVMTMVGVRFKIGLKGKMQWDDPKFTKL